eukprot:TRINITY_DN17756_c0_g1_i3.p1 TRINITY_DN17756_c0_g1~~TRINITY_DN17756_c0_g1_i3.p1  ORF type:complete len:298 (+),score=69.28 TRINITY_DN17756_c0_g1_i3:238-1131(+)
MTSIQQAMGGFLAGAWGGMVECVVVQPFDMVKTRHQLSADKAPTIIGSFREIYNEGGVSRFYRGALPEMAGMVPKTAFMLSAYDHARMTLQGPAHEMAPGPRVEFMSGVVAAVPEAIAFTPFQVVKIRLQAKQHLGKYKHTMHALRSIAVEEGGRALFLGLSTTMIRNAVWNGVYFPTMYLCKSYMMHEPGKENKLWWAGCTLLSGFMGGTLATCFNCPLDVVKSRMQSQITGTGQALKYRYTLASLIMIWQQEGFKGLYKGFAPKAVSYTHLRAHETPEHLVCRLLLEKKKKNIDK